MEVLEVGENFHMGRTGRKFGPRQPPAARNSIVGHMERFVGVASWRAFSGKNNLQFVHKILTKNLRNDLTF